MEMDWSSSGTVEGSGSTVNTRSIKLLKKEHNLLATAARGHVFINIYIYAYSQQRFSGNKSFEAHTTHTQTPTHTHTRYTLPLSESLSPSSMLSRNNSWIPSLPINS